MNANEFDLGNMNILVENVIKTITLAKASYSVAHILTGISKEFCMSCVAMVSWLSLSDI
jgi:hypothetical protein